MHDRDVFRLFHTNTVSPELEPQACQCDAVETALKYATDYKIPVDSAEITCEECRKKFKLPVPKDGFSEEIADFDITPLLIKGKFDYLCKSTASTPSID